MRIWNKKMKHDRELERRLRDERPEARDGFVQMLAGKTPAPRPRPRRRGVPRVALIAAVTLVLAISLGSAGALGYASSSLHTFGSNVAQIVKSDKQGKKSEKNNASRRFNRGRDNDPGDGHVPFHHQYGILIPVCHHGQLQFVPLQLVLFRLFTEPGYYLPAFTCTGQHHNG